MAWRIAPPTHAPLMYVLEDTQTVLLTQPMLFKFSGHAALKPDGRHIAVYNLRDAVDLYAVGPYGPQQVPRHTYKLDKPKKTNLCLQVAFINHGSGLICGTTTGNVCVWDTASGEYFQLLGHSGMFIDDASVVQWLSQYTEDKIQAIAV